MPLDVARPKILPMAHEHKQPKPPKELSGYLDAMARVMFQTGISWRVVEAKWPGIQEAFRGFEPERVARLTTKDIDRLMDDTRVIRNRKKLEAIVSNARRNALFSWLCSLRSRAHLTSTRSFPVSKGLERKL